MSTVTGSGSAASSASSTADTYSSSKALVPWYEYHAYQELSSRQFRSLEEQLYIKKAQLKRHLGQHLAILIPNTNVQITKAPTLKDLPVRDRHRREFVQACVENAGCFKTPQEAGREIESFKETILTAPNRDSYQAETVTVESEDTTPPSSPLKLWGA